MKIGEDRFIEANGIRIHTITAGSGFPVILLHGFPESSFAWRYQIPVLAKQFHVIAPDLRGYGETDRPLHIEDYKKELLVDDISGLIHALGYEKAHIVGHDWGGVIAWHLAIHQPEIIERLVVLNCPHPYKFKQALSSNYRQMLKSWYLFFFQLPILPEFLIIHNLSRCLKAAFDGAITKEDLEVYKKLLEQPNAVAAALNYYRAAFKYPSKSESSKKIAAPTLLIWGEDDAALSKELTLNMECLFSGSFEKKIIPKCSHWVNEEQPEVVNQLLMDFLIASAETALDKGRHNIGHGNKKN